MLPKISLVSSPISMLGVLMLLGLKPVLMLPIPLVLFAMSPDVVPLAVLYALIEFWLLASVVPENGSAEWLAVVPLFCGTPELFGEPLPPNRLEPAPSKLEPDAPPSRPPAALVTPDIPAACACPMLSCSEL